MQRLILKATIAAIMSGVLVSASNSVAEVRGNSLQVNGQTVSEISDVRRLPDGSDAFRAYASEHETASRPSHTTRSIVHLKKPSVIEALKERWPHTDLSAKETHLDQKTKAAIRQAANAQKIAIEREQQEFQVKLRSIGATTHAETFKTLLNASVVQLNEQQRYTLKNEGYEISSEAFLYPALDQSTALIGAPQVWNLQGPDGLPLDGRGVKVGIIDTGIDYTHPAFGSCPRTSNINTANCLKVRGGKDFVGSEDLDPWDEAIGSGHGTHVAATVAGDGVLRGVAPHASLYALKVFGPSGGAYEADILQAIEYALDPNSDGDFADRLDVINLSLGGAGDSNTPLARALDNVSAAGIIPVVSAGNSGPASQTIGSPGTSREAITVGASYKQAYADSWDGSVQQDQVTGFSSRGIVVSRQGEGDDASISVINKPDVIAPGSQICAARASAVTSGGALCNGNNHHLLQGTSMAAPHVAGLAALLRQRNPNWSVSDIKATIRNSAVSLTDPNSGAAYDSRVQGMGRVDALSAVNSNNRLQATLEFRLHSDSNFFELIGSATGPGFQNYRIEMSDVNGTTWSTIAESTSPVAGGPLGTFSNQLFQDFLGFVKFRLTVNANDQHATDLTEGSIGLIQPPITPAITAVEENPEDGRLQIRWVLPPHQQGIQYYVYRRHEGDENQNPIWYGITAGYDRMPYRWATADGLEYHFQIRAYNAYTGVWGAFSERVSGRKRGTLQTPISALALTASQDRNDGVLISWKPSPLGPTNNFFVIQRMKIDQDQIDFVPSESFFREVGGTTGTTFLDTSAEAGVRYHYSVVASTQASNRGISSDVVTGMRLPGNESGPSAPTNLAVSIRTASWGTRYWNFSWTPSSDPLVTGYRILMSDYPVCGHMSVYSLYDVPASAHSVELQERSGSRPTFWGIRAKQNEQLGPCVQGGVIAPAQTSPLAPLITHAAPRPDNTAIVLKLKSDPRASHASSYEIFRINSAIVPLDYGACLTLNTYAPLATIAASSTETEFTDTSIEIGEGYAYLVKAKNEFGTSICSESALVSLASMPTQTVRATQLQQVGPAVLVGFNTPEALFHPSVRGVEIFRSSTSQLCASDESFRVVPLGNNQLLDSLVENGTSYTYSARIVSHSGAMGACTNLGTLTVKAPLECEVDFNDDGRTNNSDLSILLTMYGSTTEPGNGADSNGDGLVNGADLSALLNMFGCQSVPFAPSSAPERVTASRWFTDRVRLSWESIDSANSYDVEYANSPDGPFASIGNVRGVSTDHLGLSVGHLGFYRVRARNIRGPGPWSELVEGRAGALFVQAPAGVSATDGTFAGEVRITWAAEPLANDFEIYRSSTIDGNYASIGTATTRSFSDFSAQAGVTYWYRVKARRLGSESELSEPNSGYAAALPPPSTPQNLVASDGTSPAHVAITWTTVTGATNYLVEFATSPLGAFQTLAEVTGLSHLDTSIAVGETRWYRVRARNAAGISAASNVDSGYRGSTSLPPAPSGFSVSSFPGWIRLIWNSVVTTPNVTSYRVYRSSTETGTYSLHSTVPYLSSSTISHFDYPPYGSCYWYKVSAVNSSGEGAQTSPQRGCAG